MIDHLKHRVPEHLLSALTFACAVVMLQVEPTPCKPRFLSRSTLVVNLYPHFRQHLGRHPKSKMRNRPERPGSARISSDWIKKSNVLSK